MSAHTPGPWQTGPQFYSRELKAQVVPVSEVNCARAIATVYAGFGDGEQVARLIAAAPDLLAVVEHALLRALADSEFAAECRAALAKARGGA